MRVWLADQQIGEIKRNFPNGSWDEISKNFYKLIDEVRAYRDEVLSLKSANDTV